MERYTVEDFNNGITDAVNGLGHKVTVVKITDSLLLAQGFRFKYSRPNNGSFDTVTFVDNNGKLLNSYDSVLDLFRI